MLIVLVESIMFKSTLHNLSWCVVVFTFLRDLPSSIVFGDLVTVPHSVVVVASEIAEFNCSTTDNRVPVTWEFLPVGVQVPKVIFYLNEVDSEFRALYKVDVIVGSASRMFYLTILKAEASLAGTYTCIDNAGFGTRATAELVVTDQDLPVCTSSMPTDGVLSSAMCGLNAELISVSCSMVYSGNVAPHIDWKHNSAVDIEYKLKNISIFGVKVENQLLASPTPAMNGVKFACHVELPFSRAMISCYFEKINVFYETGMEDRFAGCEVDKLTCPLDSNPPPRSFVWIDAKTHQVVNENREMTIVTPSYAYYCNASYSIRGKDCRITWKHAECDSATSSMAAAVAVPVVLVVVALLIAGVLIILVKTKRLHCCHNARADDTIIPNEDIRLANLETDGIRIQFEVIGLLKDSEGVVGIALLNSCIYVLTEKGQLYVHSANEPYQRINVIRVGDGITCQDMIAYMNHYLFVTDLGNLRRLPVNNNNIQSQDFEKTLVVKTIGLPSTLSLTRPANLLLVSNRKELFMYDPLSDDLRLVTTFNISQNLQHAIEISQSTYVLLEREKGVSGRHTVSRRSIEDDDSIDVCFGGVRGGRDDELDMPEYLVMDECELVYVADCNNGRILVLDLDLNLLTILSNEKHKITRPRRLCYDRETRQLLVGMVKGGVCILKKSDDIAPRPTRNTRTQLVSTTDSETPLMTKDSDES